MALYFCTPNKEHRSLWWRYPTTSPLCKSPLKRHCLDGAWLPLLIQEWVEEGEGGCHRGGLPSSSTPVPEALVPSVLGRSEHCCAPSSVAGGELSVHVLPTHSNFGCQAQWFICMSSSRAINFLAPCWACWVISPQERAGFLWSESERHSLFLP